MPQKNTGDMKKDKFVSEKEEENKKRGLLITFFVHAVVLCLAILPLMSATENLELAENTIEFTDFDDIIIEEPDVQFVDNVNDKARKNESNEPSETKEDQPTPEPTPAPEPLPEPTPVETVEDDEAPVVTPVETPNDKDVQLDETPPKVDPKPDTKPTPSKPSGSASDKNKPGGNATNNTNASGDGGDDDSLQEGVFGRKVMKRPNIKGLTKKKGRIAIKVCVSQEGTVIATKYLQKLSTINEAKLIASAMRAARKYRFDVDYTAPKKQWGKLTFVFQL
jgi:outer membrane biosynthesis protein TonB